MMKSFVFPTSPNDGITGLEQAVAVRAKQVGLVSILS